MLEFITGSVPSVETLAPAVLTFLLNYWIHSSIVLLLAFAAVRLQWLKADANGEMLLKAALLLGVFSALAINVRPGVLDMTWHIQRHSGQPREAQQATLEIGFQDDAVASSVVAVGSSPDQSTKELALHGLADIHQLADKEAGISQTASIAQPTKSLVASETMVRLSFWLVVYWIVGVVMMSVLHGYQRYQLRRMMRHKEPLNNVMLHSGLASLKQQAGYEGDIKLYSSSALASPVVLSSKEILLPEVFVTQYSSVQQQAALAHELAHLKRKDMQWQLVYQIFDILFFFQPLNRVIRREIYQMVEQRADDMASQWTGNPKALAEALSVTAQQQLGTRHLQWGLAMKCEKSNLLVRVENLLRGGVEKTKAKTIVSLALLWSLVLVSGPGISLSVTAATPTQMEQQPEKLIVPTKPAANSYARSSSSSSHSFSFSEVENDNAVGSLNIAYSSDEAYWNLTSKLKGRIRFNQEETQIVFFPPDSELDVRIDDGADKRRLTISRDKGDTEYSYYLNRQQMDIDDDPQWLAVFIPELLRMTGWNAKERVEKLFEQGGLTAVLEEIQLIIGEEVKARYLVLLPELKAYTSQEVNLILQAADVIRSDFQKSRTLRTLFQNIKLEGIEWFSDENLQLFLAVTSDIESDVEMVRVMRSLAMAVPLESKVWPSVFAHLQSVQSDFELRRLLSELITHRPLRAPQLSEMLQLTSTIESDFELSNLLIHMVEQSEIPDTVSTKWLESAATLQSDFEMGRALQARVASNVSNEELLPVIRLARDEIQSDFELANFFKALIQNQDISRAVRDELYDSLSEIQSDHERLGVLQNLKAADI